MVFNSLINSRSDKSMGRPEAFFIAAISLREATTIISCQSLVSEIFFAMAMDFSINLLCFWVHELGEELMMR